MKQIFLIVGGPGFGKTTIVCALKKKGYYCAFDPCTAEFFRECMQRLGTRDTHSYELNKEVLMKRVEEYEHAPENQMCFFDRGIPDSLAYLKEIPEEFLGIAKAHKYMPVVFVTPPWREIHGVHEGRHEGFEEATKVHGAIVGVYRSLGYTLVELPKAPVDERVEFILNKIKAFQSKESLK